MKKYILCVTLNPVYDRMVFLKEEAKAEFKTIKEVFSAGGKGVNVSRALKSLGVHSFNTGLLGGINGNHIEKLLEKEKLASHFQSIKSNNREHTTFIQSDKVFRVFGVEPRVSIAEQKSFLNNFKKMLSSASMVVFSGAVPKGFKNNIYYDLIRLAADKKVPSVCDTRGAAFKKVILAKPFLIKPNLSELAQIIPKERYSIEDLKACLLSLYQKGISNSVISLGEDGAVGYNGKDMFWMRPKKAKLVSYVGCGDVLVAGFICAYFKKLSFKDSLAYAVAVATTSGLNEIPGKVDKQKIRSILETLKIYDLNQRRIPNAYFRP